MKQKLKQAGLFAILAVFTMSLTTGLIGDAEATEKVSIIKVQHIAEPSLLQIGVHDQSDRLGDFVVTGDAATFTVVYAVLDLAENNAEILVTSDTESVKGETMGNNADTRAIITVHIDAVDPASIKAEILG